MFIQSSLFMGEIERLAPRIPDTWNNKKKLSMRGRLARFSSFIFPPSLHKYAKIPLSKRQTPRVVLQTHFSTAGEQKLSVLVCFSDILARFSNIAWFRAWEMDRLRFSAESNMHEIWETIQNVFFLNKTFTQATQPSASKQSWPCQKYHFH